MKGTSEKLKQMLRSHKIRPTCYTGNNFHKLLCKPKGRVATEDKNIVYVIDFGESKQPLIGSDEYKGSVRNCNYEKNNEIRMQ